MFNARFLNSSEGIGKNSGKAWYRTQLLCDTVEGGVCAADFFVDQKVFNVTKTLQPMDAIKVSCGMSNNGHMTIRGIQAATQQAAGAKS